MFGGGGIRVARLTGVAGCVWGYKSLPAAGLTGGGGGGDRGQGQSPAANGVPPTYLPFVSPSLRSTPHHDT